MSLSSIQVERHALSGLVNNPDILAEVESFMSEKDFVAQPHSTIYSVLKSSYLANEKIDKVLLAQKIKNLGIAFKGEIDIFSYLESITFTPLTKDATIKACKELVKLRVLREIDGTCNEIQSHIKKSVNQELEATITEIDGIYGAKINSFAVEDGEVDLFDGMEDLVEERGNNPVEETGLQTPYPEFNRLYGGLRAGNLYIIAARAKAGKSNWIDETASEMSKMHKCPVLILDTELSTEEVQFRTIAAKSGVPMWFIETGNFRKNPDYLKRVRDTLKGIKTEYNVTHYAIGNKKIEQVISIARRWYLKKVGRGNKCLICFDYIKALDKLGYNQSEFALMGEKVDALKKLAEELQCPVLSAVQSNRQGITSNKSVEDLNDDESSVAVSDRITWYSSGVWILRRRVSEEIVLDTIESGSHKLICLVNRFCGRDAAGHQDKILRVFPDGKKKYINNFVNFDIKNFKVTECGSLKDSIARANAQFLVSDKPEIVEETL